MKKDYMQKKFTNFLLVYNKFPKISIFFARCFQFSLYISDQMWYLLKGRKISTKKSKKEKVLLVFLSNLGDIIINLKLANAYRELFPKEKYELTFLCQDIFLELVEYQNIYDRCFGININNFISKRNYRYEFYKKMLENNFSYIYSLASPTSVLGSDVLIIRMLKAKEKISFYETLFYSSFNKIPFITRKSFTKLIPVDSNIFKTQTDINKKFFENISNKNIKLKDTLLKEKKLNFKLPKKYYIIFPTATNYLRMWNTKKFSEIAKKIYKKTRFSLLVCGTQKDSPIIEKMLNEIGSEFPVINLINKTSGLDLIEIIRRASLVITNDTSAYHISISTNTPVVVIAPGGHYNRFIKYGESYENVKIVTSNNQKCFNCEHHCKHIKKDTVVWKCLDEISVDQVWKEAKILIKKDK